MRRLDIEEVLGRVELPEIEGGQYLVEILWRVGPVRNEAAIAEQDLESWERRRGVELAPWEADLLVDLSRAYLMEMYAARSTGALPAWKPAIAAWKHVTDEINRPVKSEEQERNGPRK